MAGLVLCAFTVYYAVLVLLIFGWSRSLYKPTGRSAATGEVAIAVVIPVRNEEKTIGQLLDDIMAQELPAGEILVVNDHSHDETAARVKEKMLLHDSVRWLELKGEYGKKRALDFGIRESNADIIVTTDADCRVGTNWLKSICNHFQDDDIMLVAGAVRMETDGSLFSSLQAMEFASLIGTGAATLSLGVPTMGNGANLAFRRKAFEEVEGYEGNFHVASGDDEFLLHKIARAYPKGIKFNTEVQSVVTTKPLKSIRDFFHQRIRWSSKWRHNRNPASILLAILIFIIHTSIIIAIISLFTGHISPVVGGSLLFIRALLEFIFLKRVMYFLGVSWKWSIFILWQLLYPLYSVVFGFLANGKSYQWKDRRIQVKAESGSLQKV